MCIMLVDEKLTWTDYFSILQNCIWDILPISFTFSFSTEYIRLKLYGSIYF